MGEMVSITSLLLLLSHCDEIVVNTLQTTEIVCSLTTDYPSDVRTVQ